MRCVEVISIAIIYEKKWPNNNKYRYMEIKKGCERNEKYMQSERKKVE